VARAIEPGAPRPARRLAALRALSDAGVRTGVSVSPILPGLNDATIPAVLSAAKDAGASMAFMTMLRLPAEVEDVFVARVREALPLRAERILRAVRELRGGDRLNDARFGERMRGRGERWRAIEGLFALHARKLGLETSEVGEAVSKARVAKTPRRGQLRMFEP
jgi:DNA repair photolyase